MELCDPAKIGRILREKLPSLVEIGMECVPPLAWWTLEINLYLRNSHTSSIALIRRALLITLLISSPDPAAFPIMPLFYRVRAAIWLLIIGWHGYVMGSSRAKRCLLFRYYDKAAERVAGVPSLVVRAAGGLARGVLACLVVVSSPRPVVAPPRPVVAPPSEAPALPCSVPNAGVLPWAKHTLLSARPRIFEGRKRCLAPRPPRRSHRTATAGENGCEHPVVDGGGAISAPPPSRLDTRPPRGKRGCLTAVTQVFYNTCVTV